VVSGAVWSLGEETGRGGVVVEIEGAGGGGWMLHAWRRPRWWWRREAITRWPHGDGSFGRHSHLPLGAGHNRGRLWYFTKTGFTLLPSRKVVSLVCYYKTSVTS